MFLITAMSLQAGASLYTVQDGDSLASIAAMNNVPPEVIMGLNHLESSTLQVGQTINLGSVMTEQSSATPSAMATVPADVQPTPAPRQVAPPRAIGMQRTGRLQRGLFTPTNLPAVTPRSGQRVIAAASTGAAAWPSSIYLADVGYQRQSMNNCGPVSVISVLNYYSQNINQQSLKRVLRPRGQLMRTETASRYLQAHGFSAPVRRGGTIEGLKNYLAAGVPVIVLQYHSRPGRLPHFRVVRGYDEAQGIIIMSDSLSGPNVALTENDFDLLWNTQGRQYIPVSRNS